MRTTSLALWLAVAVGLACVGAPDAPSAQESTVRPSALMPAETTGRRALMPAEADVVGRYAAVMLAGAEAPLPQLPPILTDTGGAVYVAARANGLRLVSTWADGPSAGAALDAALATLTRELGERRASVTAIEIDLCHSFQEVATADDRRVLSNINRGLIGVEFIGHGQILRFAPTDMIARNIGFGGTARRFGEQAGTFVDPLEDPNVVTRRFEADALLVDVADDPGRTTILYRGNKVVPIEAVTAENVRALGDALAGWMTTNLQPDGRMVYKYWPSRGEESDANNAIRQWMATVALGRAALLANDLALLGRVVDNIDYNLARMYSEEGVLGTIDDRGKVKLGAVALAALALLEHPERERWGRQGRALSLTVDALWSEDGRFRTFLRPADDTSNQNFYPGEALLLWASLYEITRDQALLERIMTSMRTYRAWHLENRNPAFVPWHTQAYAKVWQITGSEELRDWIFAMNDWLVEIQQWDDIAAYPDARGRFYDPDRPFGPPHASSTGVYLEGLVDAWQVAVASGDAARAERYRKAIMRGLRSVMQLTFLDDVDMFYVSRKERVRGGVRTTVYDNEIRVDNVQHNLMAIQKVLLFMPDDAFRP